MTKPTAEQAAYDREIEQSDSEMFDENRQQVDHFRNDIQTKQTTVQKQIIAIVEYFMMSATTKLQKLEEYHAAFVELIEEGNTASVLATIGEHLASDSPDGIFTGKI